MKNEIQENQKKAIDSILEERQRQNQRWGVQNHNMVIWSAILAEECGEFSEAALHTMFGGKCKGNLRNELVQVAAVALQILEHIDAGQTQ